MKHLVLFCGPPGKRRGANKSKKSDKDLMRIFSRFLSFFFKIFQICKIFFKIFEIFENFFEIFEIFLRIFEIFEIFFELFEIFFSGSDKDFLTYLPLGKRI